jgi:predicted RNA-binding protein with RPS1 domain
MSEQNLLDSSTTAEHVKNIGCIVEAEVKGSFSHGAHLRIDGLPEPGFLHASQVKPGGLDVPVSSVLRVGQRLSVQITGYNKARSSWEVSRQAVILREEWLAKGPPVDEKCIATVTRVTAPFGAFLLLPSGIPAFSGVTKNPRLWEFMSTTGRLAIGASLAVQIKGWDKRGRGVNVGLDLGNPENLQMGTVHEATVVHIVCRFLKKSKCEVLHQVIYAELPTHEIAHAYANEYLFPEKLFSLGQKITVRIIDARNRRFYYPVVRSEIVKGPLIEGKTFEVGEVVVGRISEASEHFALCLLSDGVHGLIHHSSIIKECEFDTRKYLHPGDWVRVRVFRKSEAAKISWKDSSLQGTNLSSNRPFYQLEFVALDSPGDLSAERNPLIDLLAVREQGKSGGYQRDNEFRRIVLEAYDFTCCICAERYCIGSASPMEAAHIIPRSKRGAEILANSLCFCPVHHWAFDRGFITIDQDYNIRTCEDILSLRQENNWLGKSDGQKAHLPDVLKPELKALAWHNENVFLK